MTNATHAKSAAKYARPEISPCMKENRSGIIDVSSVLPACNGVRRKRSNMARKLPDMRGIIIRRFL